MDHARDRAIDEVRKIISELGKEHDIRAAYVFGSYAHGGAMDYSDIDVAIILGRYRNGGPFDERFDIFHQVQRRNSRVEAICFTQAEFEGDAASVIRTIKKEGVRIL